MVVSLVWFLENMGNARLIDDVDILLRAMAEQGAVLLHQSMGATSVLDAKNCLLRRFV